MKHLKRLSKWMHSPSGKLHLLFVGSLLLFAIFNFRAELTHPSYIRVWKDVHGLYYYGFEVVRDSILRYHQFPHWSVYIYAGFPFFAYPQSIVFSINTLMLVLLPFLSIETVITLFQVIALFVSGLVMYIVLTKLDFRPRVAFIGAMLQMFSWYLKSASYSWLGRYSSMLLLPCVFYCLWKALYTKDWFRYGLLGGLFYALQFFVGGIDMFMFTLVAFLAIVIVYVVASASVRRITKVILLFSLVAIVTLLLVSIQLLPTLEFSAISSQRPFELQESIGDHVVFSKWTDIFDMFIGKQAPGLNLYDSAYIGWIGFALVLIGLSVAWKKRLFWFSVVLMILAILTVTGSWFYALLWKYVVGFDRMHHVDRGLFLFTFGSVMMATLGMAWLDDKLSKYSKLIIRSVYFLIVAAIFWQLVIPNFELEPPEDFHAMLEQNQLLKTVAAEPGLFRIHNFNTVSIAGHASSYATPYGLQILYGVTSVWIPEFFNVYLGLAHSSPAKFYGMLNTKYLYANDTLNVTGLTFVKKFDACDSCVEDEGTDKGVDGPYLYRNELFLPRAYFTNNAILFTGAEKPKDKPFHISLMPVQMQLMYQIMLDPRFEPADLVLVVDDLAAVGQHDPIELTNYKAVIVTKGPVDQKDLAVLSSYKNAGRKIIPDISEGSTSFDDEDITYLFNLSKKTPTKVVGLTYDFYSPNEQILSLTSEEGWVVVSEKYTMFEGWHAKIDGKPVKLFKANGVQTALHVPAGSQKLEFYYSSWRFNVGLASLVLTVGFICWYFWRPKALQGQQTDMRGDEAIPPR